MEKNNHATSQGKKNQAPSRGQNKITQPLWSKQNQTTYQDKKIT